MGTSIHIFRPALSRVEVTRLYALMSVSAEWWERTSDHDHSNRCAWLKGAPWRWLRESLWAKVRPINAERWAMGLTGEAHVQFTRYRPGEGYGWHRDHEPENPTLAKRALTLVVQLARAEGGGLEFQDGGPVEMAFGDGALFPGAQFHRAVPPTRGTRDSLIFWMFTT